MFLVSIGLMLMQNYKTAIIDTGVILLQMVAKVRHEQGCLEKELRSETWCIPLGNSRIGRGRIA
jgi:hypothetical protein